MRVGIFCFAYHYPSEGARDIRRLYDEMIAQAEAADALGFDSYWVAEHHFHEHGVVPNPALFLTAIAQRTRHIKLGCAVAVLPFANPIRVAEDYAMLDIVPGGRLKMGLGSGYLAHEFAGFGIPFDEKRERFDEGLDVLWRAWTGLPFSHDGKYWRLQDVRLNVVPLQQPSPRLWIATLRRLV